MSKRYKRQSVDSNLFHHRLINILLIHHLSTVGDYWDKFLVRNGFSMTVPVVNPNLGEPLIKNKFGISRNGPDSLNRNPLDVAMPSNPSSEKTIVELEVNEPLMPKFDASSNFIIKPGVEIACKQTKQKCTDLGFQNKKAGHLISSKLRNQNRYQISIRLIEVDEVSDSQIEYFIALEDLDFQGYKKKFIVPTEPYDFVMNFPPCLKGEEGFSSIGLNQGKIVDKVDTSMLDCTLHRPGIPHVQCDVCLHWIERYYTNIPILQARIKTLTAQNESLRQENLEHQSARRRGKINALKDQGNIIIKNATSVKAIVNSELPDPSLVNF
jgi:hypothetical protein